MHTIIVVRVPGANVSRDGVESSLADMMAPYNEDPDEGDASPEAFWDWYLIGGRWLGYFPLKDPATATVGEPGVFNNQARQGGGDVCHPSEIDLDSDGLLTPFAVFDAEGYREINQDAAVYRKWLADTSEEDWLVAVDVHS